MMGDAVDGAGSAVLVTGGSRGIGRAVAERLARDGFAVAVGYASRRDSADEVVASIERAGGRAAAVRADLGDHGSVEAVFGQVERALGRLRGLVANAGVLGTQARIDEQTPEGLAALFGVNVIGTALYAGAAVRRLSTRHDGAGGEIVLLSSVAARLGGLAGLVPYAATKGAIETLTKGLAVEVAREGVRVNAVAPGVIGTEMVSEEVRAAAAGFTPIGRIGQAEEVAEAVAWLMSPVSSFVTGSVLTVSGGR